MMEKNNDFSQTELARMLKQPETQALLTRLQQLDPSAIDSAVKMASNGNTDAARELLEPLMQDEQIQHLTQKLRQRNG